MRSMVLVRCSVGAFGLAALGLTATQFLDLGLAIPTQNLRIAWSLISALLQL